MGVFRPAEFVFGDYFGGYQHADAQETISTEIIVFSSNLSVPGGISTFSVRSWGLFRYAKTH